LRGLYGVLGSVYFHFVVRFNIVCGALSCWHGDVCACCGESCGKGNFKRRRGQSLSAFFYYCYGCFVQLKLRGHRRQGVPDDINAHGCGCFEVVVDSEGSAVTTSYVLEANFCSDVINFRLEQVIIPRCFRLEVVVCAACTLTTTSMLVAMLLDEFPCSNIIDSFLATVKMTA